MATYVAKNLTLSYYFYTEHKDKIIVYENIMGINKDITRLASVHNYQGRIIGLGMYSNSYQK